MKMREKICSGKITIGEIYNYYKEGKFIFPKEDPEVGETYNWVVAQGYECKEDMINYVLNGTRLTTEKYFSTDALNSLDFLIRNNAYSIFESHGFFEVFIDFIENKFKYKNMLFCDLDDNSREKYLGFTLECRMNYRRGDIDLDL